MATEESFEFNTNGEVMQSEAEQVSTLSPAVAAASPSIPEDATGIERISLMIADPEAALPDIMRLIALEMAKVMKRMTNPEQDPLARGIVSMRDLNDQIKAYRELQKTLTESDTLSKKDILNLDGPKFKFVFKELVRLFQQAMKDARVEEDLAQNVMMQFGDALKQNDEAIRRELNKIESGR